MYIHHVTSFYYLLTLCYWIEVVCISRSEISDWVKSLLFFLIYRVQGNHKNEITAIGYLEKFLLKAEWSEVTIPGGFQETFRCYTEGCGVGGKYLW